MKLTDTTVKSIDRVGITRDETQSGFAVRVGSNGKKSYIFEAKIYGKSVRRVIGNADTLKCAEARQIAREVYVELRQGVDRFSMYRKKVDDEKLKKLAEATKLKAPTLFEIIDRYIERNDHLRPDTQRFYNGLKVELKPYHYIDVARLTSSMLEDMYIEISNRVSSIRATKAIKFLSTLCNFVEVPFPRIKFHMEKPKARMARLEPNHGKLIWEVCLQNPRRKDLAAVGLMMSTGMRIAEVRRLTTADVDLIEGHATLRETKNHRPHRVYLTDSCMTILRPHLNYLRKDDLVFPNVTGMNNVKSTYFGSLPKCGNHDLRKMFVITASTVGIDTGIIKNAINHAGNDITLAHYMHSTPAQLRRCFEYVTQFYESKRHAVV